MAQCDSALDETKLSLDVNAHSYRNPQLFDQKRIHRDSLSYDKHNYDGKGTI